MNFKYNISAWDGDPKSLESRVYPGMLLLYASVSFPSDRVPDIINLKWGKVYFGSQFSEVLFYNQFVLSFWAFGKLEYHAGSK
jgi:hypothetical protein